MDLLIQRDAQLIPVEIKAVNTWSAYFLKGIKHLSKAAGERAQPGFVVYNGDHQGTVEGTRIMNCREIGMLDEILSKDGGAQ